MAARAAARSAIFNLMEDAATARSPARRSGSGCTTTSRCADGQTVTRELVERIIDEELAEVARREGPGRRRWDDATALFSEMALSDDFPEFLTLPAYERMP